MIKQQKKIKKIPLFYLNKILIKFLSITTDTPPKSWLNDSLKTVSSKPKTPRTNSNFPSQCIFQSTRNDDPFP